MSGIAALAAAAAATQKITTNQPGTATTASSGVKVMTPTIVTPSGIKVTPVQGRQGMKCVAYLSLAESLKLADRSHFLCVAAILILSTVV